jgi:hypothetical protein
MDMRLDYYQNKAEISRVRSDYASSFEGINACLDLHMNFGDCERMLFLERQSIDINNRRAESRFWQFFKVQPLRCLMLHVVRLPINPNSVGRNREYSYYVTDAEVYPPFPDEEVNKVAVEGIIKALEAIELNMQDQTPEIIVD